MGKFLLPLYIEISNLKTISLTDRHFTPSAALIDPPANRGLFVPSSREKIGQTNRKRNVTKKLTKSITKTGIKIKH